ncbi:DUF3299 domain-containing protein [Lacimicrobium alkaliphilum]|uniref:DUF3299 domain-containing protein n=1 Tax=Lacimicrobium alkaliphilum TaxID=1526571 RepID=A0A0U3ASI4_9ALTE|nr:DUF3299 domain-containing protein [Lacimicrobium alkaliphilum]ALS97023.1 hypothetical protein AT746_01165 [Lacimicrobium alkaliphilum]
MKKWIIALVLMPVLAFAEEPLELFWEDLIPEDYQLPEQLVDHEANNNMVQQNLDAPVVEALNGSVVRIPGFVVPLEGDEEKLTEFLLVPFFGACIHVPPPPPNQIVHVKFPEGAPVENLWDAVWLTGTLSTEGWKGEIATVGYRLLGTKVEPYDG